MTVMTLDLGFGWTKGKCGSRLFRQPSIIGGAQPLFDENRKNGYLIYDNHFIGELALKHSDVKYYSLKDNKSETWTTGILLRAALSYLQGGETNLVTGLPVDFYFQQKEAFSEMIEQANGSKGTLEVFGEGVYTQQLDIRSHKIVPQPLGAAMDYLLDDTGQLARRDEARKQLLVIDWGRYTLDLLILDGMEIHKASCSPPDLGIEAAYQLLRRYLRDHFGKAPATYAMDKVMETCKYEGYDVTPLIKVAFQTVIQQIQMEVENLNLRFDIHILAGGQAARLNEFLTLPNKVEGDQLSNINGYGKIGRRSWLAI